MGEERDLLAGGHTAGQAGRMLDSNPGLSKDSRASIYKTPSHMFSHR